VPQHSKGDRQRPRDVLFDQCAKGFAVASADAFDEVPFALDIVGFVEDERRAVAAIDCRGCARFGGRNTKLLLPEKYGERTDSVWSANPPV
jgi:hypothetical protein